MDLRNLCERLKAADRCMYMYIYLYYTQSCLLLKLSVHLTDCRVRRYGGVGRGKGGERERNGWFGQNLGDYYYHFSIFSVLVGG